MKLVRERINPRVWARYSGPCFGGGTSLVIEGAVVPRESRTRDEEQFCGLAQNREESQNERDLRADKSQQWEGLSLRVVGTSDQELVIKLSSKMDKVSLNIDQARELITQMEDALFMSDE